jgi:DNA polymerase-3 subunit epsilon/CBS domain-containing protein
MNLISLSTPLISLDCFAFDTETTGLDTKSARIVQIAGIRLRGAAETDEAPFDSLVNPGGGRADCSV